MTHAERTRHGTAADAPAAGPEVPFLAWAALMGGFFTAPMTAVSPFPSRMRLSDAAFVVALVLILVSPRDRDVPRFRPDDVARRLLVGVAAIVVGVVIGEIGKGGFGAPFQTLALHMTAAVLPVLLLTAPWVGEAVRRRLAGAFVAGVLASILYGLATQRFSRPAG